MVLPCATLVGFLVPVLVTPLGLLALRVLGVVAINTSPSSINFDASFALFLLSLFLRLLIASLLIESLPTGRIVAELSPQAILSTTTNQHLNQMNEHAPLATIGDGVCSGPAIGLNQIKPIRVCFCHANPLFNPVHSHVH